MIQRTHAPLARFAKFHLRHAPVVVWLNEPWYSYEGLTYVAPDEQIPPDANSPSQPKVMPHRSGCETQTYKAQSDGGGGHRGRGALPALTDWHGRPRCAQHEPQMKAPRMLSDSR
jgi:hypothetical protein